MSKDITLWTVDDEEVVTSGLGPEVSAGAYVSFDYFMTIDQPNNKAFLKRFFAKFGKDALMNTVGVGMYNAAHMAAMAIAKAGSTDTDKVREALKGLTFDGAPQGPVTMRAEDNQAVLPSYLMRVRPGWTGVERHVRADPALPSVQPKPAALQVAAALRPRGGPAGPAPVRAGRTLARLRSSASSSTPSSSPWCWRLPRSGLAVIFGLIGVINLGHGAMLTLGAYFMWWATSHGVPFVPAVLLAAVGVGLIGLLLEHILIRHFYDEPFETLLLTWGFFLVATEVIKLVFGTDFRNVPNPLPGTISLAGLELPAYRSLVGLISLLVLLGLGAAACSAPASGSRSGRWCRTARWRACSGSTSGWPTSRSSSPAPSSPASPGR